MYLRQLYPLIEPYDSGYLAVTGGHEIYWEICGNPRGIPALYLHGGPGGGCNGTHRRLFNPHLYRIVLFDQRGCARSRPYAAINANTTADLLADIESLREFLQIDRWLIVGGSWGSTLGLAYAESYPRCVSALVLRGIFLGRQLELDWLYRGGAATLFPNAWADFVAPIPSAEHHDLVAAYHRRLNSGNAALEELAARHWCNWEDSIMNPPSDAKTPAAMHRIENDKGDLAMARLSAYYFMHQAFLEENQLLRDIVKLHGIDCTLIQGRNDLVTPAHTALDLHQAWPGSKLELVVDAGHSTTEPGILHHLIEATDRHAHSHS